MNIFLTRDATRGISEQYGVLAYSDTGIPHELQTIELPWRNDAPDKSCVPAGTYGLVPHIVQSGVLAGLRTYALYGPGRGVIPDDSYLSVLPAGIPKRTGILIHPANCASQLLGCIAPGLARGQLALSGEPLANAVLSSDLAFGRLRDALDFVREPHSITIRWAL